MENLATARTKLQIEPSNIIIVVLEEEEELFSSRIQGELDELDGKDMNEEVALPLEGVHEPRCC